MVSFGGVEIGCLDLSLPFGFPVDFGLLFCLSFLPLDATLALGEDLLRPFAAEFVCLFYADEFCIKLINL